MITSTVRQSFINSTPSRYFSQQQQTEEIEPYIERAGKLLKERNYEDAKKVMEEAMLLAQVQNNQESLCRCNHNYHYQISPIRLGTSQLLPRSLQKL